MLTPCMHSRILLTVMTFSFLSGMNLILMNCRNCYNPFRSIFNSCIIIIIIIMQIFTLVMQVEQCIPIVPYTFEVFI